MNKLIMFEAPDNCFKTTNVEFLAKEFFKQNIPVHQLHYTSLGIKDTKQCISLSKSLYHSMFSLANTTQNSFICDRAHGGEVVYGKIYRNYEADFVYDVEDEWKTFHPTWWKTSVHLIVMYDEPENLIARDDGLSFSVELEKKKIEIERFKLFFEKSLVENKLLIKVTGKSREDIANEIKEFVFGKEHE